GDDLTCKDFSVAEIKNTTSLSVYPPGGIWDLGLWGWSRLKFSGGEISWIDIGGNATATLSGGKIGTIRSGYMWGGWGPIEIICRDYSYNPTSKKLAGTWNVDNNNDGQFDAFNIQLVDAGGYYDTTINNIKFTIIPEPLTLILFGLGGLFLQRRSSRQG
ncbi:MAG: PEP-CTERM sorting domain-containing protein, partial [Planctomycetota bacterium]|nr:PEP-CTERM sorting domain-containing protein [Planctomycetota bacterium]